MTLGSGAVGPQAAPVGTVSGGGVLNALADNRDVDTLIKDGIAKYENQDYIGARRDFEEAVSKPEFIAHQPTQRAAGYYLLALCEYFLDDFVPAVKHLKMAEMFGSTDLLDGNFWAVKSDSCFFTDDTQCGVESLIKSIALDPTITERVSLERVGWIYRETADLSDDGKLKFAFLKALWDANYSDPDKIEPVDWLWLSLFELYIEKGDMPNATKVLAGIKSPGNLIDVLSDKRYRPVLMASGRKIDFQSSVDATIYNSRRAMEQNPKKVRPAYLYGLDLLNSGRFDEALSLVDSVIAKIDSAPENNPPYEDLDDTGNWIFDFRASVLWQLGRKDEAIAAAEKARDYSLQNGDDTVSQVINLGSYYYQIERPQDALDSVKNIGPESVSPYGTMNAMEVRVCAYSQLGDTVHQKEDLDYMMAHADDGFMPLKYALLCVNDQARLAKLLVSQLNDEKTRSSTLFSMQRFLPEKFETPYQTLLRQRFEAVLDRPEVKATIEKYGYIDAYPIYNLYH